MYSAEVDALLDQLNDAVDAVFDEHTRALLKQWTEAWEDVAEELERALLSLGDSPSVADVRRSRRLTHALDAIKDALDDLATANGITVAGMLPSATTASAAINTDMIRGGLPPRARVINWDRVNPRAMDAIITRATQQITSLSRPLSSQARAAMQRALILGIARGEGPRWAARYMVRAERTFNGGMARAMTISRTEMLDAMRSAGAVSDKANTKILAGWTWVAELGPRTCPACWSMHGTEWGVDDPGPQGHQNCRCARVPRTKSWAELGFNIKEPPSILPDNAATFERMPVADQKFVLGEKRYKAWKEGKYPMDKWATLRPNDQWRPSYVVSPLP